MDRGVQRCGEWGFSAGGKGKSSTGEDTCLLMHRGEKVEVKVTMQVQGGCRKLKAIHRGHPRSSVSPITEQIGSSAETKGMDTLEGSASEKRFGDFFRGPG